MSIWSLGLMPWLKKKIVDPFLQIIGRGAEPKQLAFSTALGLTLGIFPICGVTFFLCGFAIALFGNHCHAPSILLANFIATPIELSLVIPFLRLGEFITGGSHFPLTSDALKKVLTGQASREVLVSIGHALLGWIVVAPIVLAVLYCVFVPAFKYLIRKFSSNSGPSSPEKQSLIQPDPKLFKSRKLGAGGRTVKQLHLFVILHRVLRRAMAQSVATQATAATPATPATQRQQGGFGKTVTGIIRMAVMWYFAMKFFSPKKPADPSQLMSNLFQKGEPLDMWLYLSDQRIFNDFGNDGALLWHESNIPYAVWGQASSRSLSLKYTPSEALKHNGSLYAHVFFARSGYSPDPNDSEYQPQSAFSRTHPVVVYYPKSKSGKRRSLLNSKESEEETLDLDVKDDIQPDSKDEGSVEWISYWKPNITINLVDDFNRYSYNAIPPNVAGYLNIDPTTKNYFPIIYFNEFWLLREKLIALNDTVKELPLNLEVGPISSTKWQFFLQIEQSFQIHRSYGSMVEGEADQLKRVFLEGNPYLLLVTMVVSVMHSLFDFLAFKNDIQFWNKNKSMEGLSAKSVVVSFISQLIVFLYLFDNDTSWMILASSGIGCCIEFWKIGKAMHIEIDWSGRIPMLRFRDRDSYTNNKTKEYDDIAMKYLSYVLFLLAACFSVYSLMYEQHKSWYSWILSSLTSCVYMFGFIMMCPQLFINYKMKSVAHLPWRQMTYKFLNTIIDDLFAFVIKMPILHRLSVFRDDVIFLIYLYQRWKYPVDKRRVNEFGFGGEEDKSLVNGSANEGDSNASEEDSKKKN